MTGERTAGRAPVIGIVGTVGAGKSAVASALARLGAAVLDADREVGRLLATPEIAARIGEAFGPGALKGGEVNRGALAAEVFGDAEKRARLEGILHPPVVEACRALVASPPAGAAAVVIDAPLLFEAGLDTLCDEVWFVDAGRATRLERVRASRGWDERELDRRDAAQQPADKKRRRSDRVLINEGDERALAAEAGRALAAACDKARGAGGEE